MPLYREGTISLTEGSREVVGVNTHFGEELNPGDILVVNGASSGFHCYEVRTIESDTSLTLDIDAIQTRSNVTYVALRSVNTANNLYLMRKINEFLNERQVSLTEFREWSRGTATGGPNGDGKYPLTDRFGETVLVDSPEKMGGDVAAALGTLNSVLGTLGTAATANVTTSATDTTTGRVMSVGAGGLLGTTQGNLKSYAGVSKAGGGTSYRLLCPIDMSVAGRTRVNGVLTFGRMLIGAGNYTVGVALISVSVSDLGKFASVLSLGRDVNNLGLRIVELTYESQRWYALMGGAVATHITSIQSVSFYGETQYPDFLGVSSSQVSDVVLVENESRLELDGKTVLNADNIGFESGTFTPAIQGTVDPGTATYATRIGRYVKQGNKYDFNFHINFTGFTGTGDIKLTGLPFQSANPSGNYSALSVWTAYFGMEGRTPQARVLNNSTEILFEYSNPAGAATMVPAQASGVINISGTVFI